MTEIINRRTQSREACILNIDAWPSVFSGELLREEFDNRVNGCVHKLWIAEGVICALDRNQLDHVVLAELL